MSQQPAIAHPSVTRTYRAAIRLGEDYVTVEQTTMLPLGATDAEIEQASDLGLRIFQAQHRAVQAEVARIRADAPPPAPAAPKPASDKQRGLIDALAREAGWDGEMLAAFASEHGVEAWGQLSAAQAASLIDAIKAHKAEQEGARAEAEARRPQAPPPARHPDPVRQAQTRPDLPPVGARIRDPESPASEAQLTRISRTIERLSDDELKRLAPQVAAILGYQRVALNGLRDRATWPYLRDEAEQAHRLTKGRASQIISLLEAATANAKVAA